jgi:ABC-type lipoprotein release transport system permease subunit
MSLFSLCVRNLLYHWRANLAVLLGVVVGSAVLTGALLVGDSLRGSLRQRTLQRLEWVDQALVAPRFFRQELAGELLADQAAQRIEPAILLQSTATAEGRSTPLRGVTVLGVADSFFATEGVKDATERLTDSTVWLNSTLADALGVSTGDTVGLRLQKPSPVPRETVLAPGAPDFEEWELTVTRILSGEESGNLFNLRSEVTAPRSAFVSLGALQKRLEQTGRVNALLAQGGKPDLAQRLRARVQLADWGLVLHDPKTRTDALFQRYDRNRDGRLSRTEWMRRVGEERKPRFAAVIANAIKHKDPNVLERAEVEAYYRQHHPYLSLESRELLLESAVAEAALGAAKEVNLRSAPTLVYLARIDVAGRRIAGVIAALDPALPPPLGFLPRDKNPLTDNKILLVDWGWRGSPPRTGSAVTLTYKPAEHQGPSPDRHAKLTLAADPIPLVGLTANPHLTPEFPGITDKDSTSDWKLPFDDPKWDQQTIRQEYSEAYWDEYRATPKGYVTLAKGQELWSSPRFGSLTSIRLAPRDKTPLDRAAAKFRDELRSRLDPARGGLVFDEVKRNALEASKGGGFDFSLLFLGFSFFLIASALLLVGLLFRLNLDRRASEIGLLFAQGYRRRTVRLLLLGEGGLLALAGSLIGAALAIAYAGLLVQLLAVLWPGGVLRSFLRPHYTATSLVAGAGGALVVSLVTIAWVVRSLSRVPPRVLLTGKTTAEGEPGVPTVATRFQRAGEKSKLKTCSHNEPAVAARFQRAGRSWSKWVAAGGFLGALVLLGVAPFMPGHEAQAGTFFGSGALLLTAFLAGVLAWMRSSRTRTVEGHGWWAVARLGVRNAARHPSRSLLTAGLLASAAFLIVAVEAFRRRAEPGDGRKDAPDGGFALLAETDLPVVRDLNSSTGRRKMLDNVERQLQRNPTADASAGRAAARKLLQEVTIVAFRARAGDDASCLNLYQPRTPKILGVPKSLIERGGFAFDATEAKTPTEKANPWTILQRTDGAIPAFGEANTVTWMLHSGLGKSIAVPREKGEATLGIAGLLHDSVFQSSLLVSEEHFLDCYPSHEGYNFFLIECPRGREAEVKQLLEAGLADRGLEVTSTAERLASYLAVENTYLTTFQALGGLGLLLGSLGLAVVLIRGVWERRAELALFRALGFRKRTLGWLVLAENGFLLVLGLVAGAVSALLAVAPHLVRGAGGVPWGNLLVLFGLVLLVGLASGAMAVVSTLRAPLIPALRHE